MSKELEVAIQAVMEGAKYALSKFNNKLVVHKKADQTVVTKVDSEVEEIIKSIISKAFPNAYFVGEETGGEINSQEFWTIDPIDGTRHFLRHTPMWAVLISLVRNGEPVLGVSYVPGMNEVMYAEKGSGAFLNDERIEVSQIDKISEAILLLGSMRFFEDKLPLTRLIESCASTRSYVSPYEYHLLASGRAEIVIDGYGKIWDIAPFKVILEEAGGKITDSEGKPWNTLTKGGISTNGRLHEGVVNIYNQK